MPKFKWTLEKLQTEALKYNSRGEFNKSSANAYTSACRKGLLDQICSHMEYLLYPWTNEELQEEALKYKTRGEFSKNNNKAYSTALNRKILDQICSHMPKHVDQSGDKNPNFKWTLEKLQAEALKYKTRGEFSKENPNAYSIANGRGVLNDVCKHMVSQVHFWTNEELKQEALKYNSKKEFERGNQKAYRAAYKRKILDKSCEHMEVKNFSGKNNPNFKWTFEKLQEEAFKYDTRTDFQKSSTAYGRAHKRNVLDHICSHMKVAQNISKAEQLLFKDISVIYPKVQILRDRKVKIKNKPHIKGFDLDIYVPELRKAIEFDGKYWHSLEGLKRSRANWPEEDLINYHQIKDSWFKSKNIRVYHIEEEDWNKDKEDCIKRCLEFLGD